MKHSLPMALVEVKIIHLLLLMTTCINATLLDNVMMQNSSVLRTKMIQLLKHCFQNRLKSIIITPDLYEDIRNIFNDSEPISVISINENYETKSVQQYLTKFDMFALTANSPKSLKKILLLLKLSNLWNIHAFFFIIGNPQEKCERAAEFLKQTWKMNLLSSLFICSGYNKNIFLYTYNPYTHRAPYPWIEMENFNRPNERWTLYMQKYSEGQNNCGSLCFDKTEFMDGYTVKAVANAKPGLKWFKNVNYHIKSLKEKNPSIEDAFFSNELFAAMNMTVIVNYDYTGYLVNGRAVGYLKQIVDGTHDLSLSYRTPIPNLKFTYPFIQISLRIITQQRNFLLPEEKIAAFYRTEILCLTAVVCLLTLGVMVMVFGKGKFVSGLFDLLRLLVGATIKIPFNTSSTRIYFFGVFQLIIILHASFQGNLSSFLTRPEREYVDHLSDLKTYDYKFYAPEFQKDIVESINIESLHVRYVPGLDCSVHVINDSTAACIEMIHRTVDPAMEYGLHISQSRITEEYVSYWCRDDWPLIEKINNYSFRLVEAGIYKYWHHHKLIMPLNRMWNKEIETTEPHARPIKINDLGFFLRFIAVGLGTSFVAFIAEVFLMKKCSQVVKKIGHALLSLVRKIPRIEKKE